MYKLKKNLTTQKKQKILLHNKEGNTMAVNNQVKKPCIGCIYFKVCGSSTRTQPCNGRMTKSEKKKEDSKNH